MCVTLRDWCLPEPGAQVLLPAIRSAGCSGWNGRRSLIFRESGHWVPSQARTQSITISLNPFPLPRGVLCPAKACGARSPQAAALLRDDSRDTANLLQTLTPTTAKPCNNILRSWGSVRCGWCFPRVTPFLGDSRCCCPQWSSPISGSSLFRGEPSFYP